jgi:hypothetical protein
LGDGSDKAAAMSGRFKQSIILLASLALSFALVLNVWSFIHAERQWKQIYILLAQAGETQSRAYKIQEKLSQIRGHLQLAAKTGEDSPRLQILVVALKTDLQEILTAQYLGEFLDEQEIINLEKDQEMLESKYSLTDAYSVSPERMLDDISLVKQHIFSILGSTTAKAQILGETAQIETQTAKYRFWFAIGFVIFLIAGIAFYLAFFLLDKKTGTSVRSHPSSPI